MTFSCHVSFGFSWLTVSQACFVFDDLDSFEDFSGIFCLTIRVCLLFVLLAGLRLWVWEGRPGRGSVLSTSPAGHLLPTCDLDSATQPAYEVSIRVPGLASAGVTEWREFFMDFGYKSNFLDLKELALVFFFPFSFISALNFMASFLLLTLGFICCSFPGF